MLHITVCYLQVPLLKALEMQPDLSLAESGHVHLLNQKAKKQKQVHKVTMNLGALNLVDVHCIWRH
jgi:hypothetical protein